MIVYCRRLGTKPVSMQMVLVLSCSMLALFAQPRLPSSANYASVPTRGAATQTNYSTLRVPKRQLTTGHRQHRQHAYLRRLLQRPEDLPWQGAFRRAPQMCPSGPCRNSAPRTQAPNEHTGHGRGRRDWAMRITCGATFERAVLTVYTGQALHPW